MHQVLGQLEIEKKRGEQLNQMKKAREGQCWWESPVDELTNTQLELLKTSLEQLKQNVAMQADRLLIQNAPQQFFASSSNAPPLGLPNFDPNNNGAMFNLPVPDMSTVAGYDNFGYGQGFY